VIVIGIGNDLRRDDGAGPAVIDELRRRDLDDVTLAVSDGEPAGLIDLWAPADLAVIVDAVRSSEGRAGRVRRLVTIDDGRPAPSSHALGLIEATRLGEALDRMPARLRIYVIEGADFGYGPGLSPPVTRAVTEVADQIAALRRATNQSAADRGEGEGPSR
jgi:hydrogenase maturation protease